MNNRNAVIEILNNTRGFHFVLDIDDTLLKEINEKHENFNKKVFPAIEWFQQRDLIILGNKIWILHPGAIELIQYLLTIPNAKVSFFSAGIEDRNKPFVYELIKKSFPKNHVEIFQKISIFSSHHLVPGRQIRQPPRFNGNMKKDLRLVLTNEELITDAILIDDDSSYVYPGQERNLLATYSHSTFDDFNASNSEIMLDDYFFDANHIFHIVGFLSNALRQPSNNLVNSLLLQYESKYEHKKYFLDGIDELRKINPKISFYGNNATINIHLNSKTNGNEKTGTDKSGSELSLEQIQTAKYEDTLMQSNSTQITLENIYPQLVAGYDQAKDYSHSTAHDNPVVTNFIREIETTLQVYMSVDQERNIRKLALEFPGEVLKIIIENCSRYSKWKKIDSSSDEGRNNLNKSLELLRSYESSCGPLHDKLKDYLLMYRRYENLRHCFPIASYWTDTHWLNIWIEGRCESVLEHATVHFSEEADFFLKIMQEFKDAFIKYGKNNVTQKMIAEKIRFGCIPGSVMLDSFMEDDAKGWELVPLTERVKAKKNVEIITIENQPTAASSEKNTVKEKLEERIEYWRSKERWAKEAGVLIHKPDDVTAAEMEIDAEEMLRHLEIERAVKNLKKSQALSVVQINTKEMKVPEASRPTGIDLPKSEPKDTSWSSWAYGKISSLFSTSSTSKRACLEEQAKELTKLEKQFNNKKESRSYHVGVHYDLFKDTEHAINQSRTLIRNALKSGSISSAEASSIDNYISRITNWLPKLVDNKKAHKARQDVRRLRTLEKRHADKPKATQYLDGITLFSNATLQPALVGYRQGTAIASESFVPRQLRG